jgi:hypothetical protein
MLILSYVNTSATSSGVNKRMRGRNVTGGSIIIIERLHHSCQPVSEKWSRYSWLLYAAAMPVCFAKHCMKFTFREFSKEMPPLLPMSSAGGASLSVLVHFFEHGRWDCPVKVGVEGQSLTAEDQLFILTQAGLDLSVTRGLGAPEARICYERAESLCHSLNRPLPLYSALIGQWRYSLITDKLTATM